MDPRGSSSHYRFAIERKRKRSVKCEEERDLPEGEATKKGECESNSRVEMRSRDMSHRIHHYHYNQSPNHTDSRKCHWSVYFVHHHRPTSPEDHEVRPDQLRDYLPQNFPTTKHMLYTPFIIFMPLNFHVNKQVLYNRLIHKPKFPGKQSISIQSTDT